MTNVKMEAIPTTQDQPHIHLVVPQNIKDSLIADVTVFFINNFDAPEIGKIEVEAFKSNPDFNYPDGSTGFEGVIETVEASFNTNDLIESFTWFYTSHEDGSYDFDEDNFYVHFNNGMDAWPEYPDFEEEE